MSINFNELEYEFEDFGDEVESEI